MRCQNTWWFSERYRNNTWLKHRWQNYTQSFRERSGGKRKRNDLYDKFSRESDSSNAEEEDSVNQGSLTSDNSNLPNDNPSSADDENSVNQGSDTIDNSNLADDNSSEGNESNGNLNDNWSIADPALKVLQFVENEGIKIDVPADDNPLFFSNLFLTDQRLNKLVTRLNTYAQKVINSSQPLR